MLLVARWGLGLAVGLVTGWWLLAPSAPVAAGALGPDPVRGASSRCLKAELELPAERLVKPARELVDDTPPVAPPAAVEASASLPSGRLVGQVVERSGRPARRLKLEVSPAVPDSGRAPSKGGLLLRFRTAWEVETDDLGHFVLDGIPKGDYWVQTRRIPSTAWARYGIRVTKRPVSADGQSLLLEVDRPHLVVHLTGHRGEPVDLPVAFDSLDPAPFNSAVGSRWSAVRRRSLMVVSVAPVRSERVFRIGGAEPGIQLAKGEFLFDARPGWSYRVGVIGPDFAWEPVVVKFPEGASSVDVAVALPPERRTGRLEVSFAKLPPKYGVMRSHMTRVYTAADRTLLWKSDKFEMRRSDFVQVIELPAGDFVLESTDWPLLPPTTPAETPWDGPIRRSDFLARVQIVGGETRHLEAVLVRAGRLRLRVSGAADASDRVEVEL